MPELNVDQLAVVTDRSGARRVIHTTKKCARCRKDTQGRTIRRDGKRVKDHYCRKCRNEMLKHHRIENLAHGLCVCGRPIHRGTLCRKCIKREADARKSHQNQCFARYGLSCFCCGETIREFLTIDHIHGGGNKHKKERKCGIYGWLVRHKFPKGYRIACFNCNCSRGRVGYCPHKRQK